MMSLFQLQNIKDRIYLVTCGSHYDTTMLFLRYQEYYESPNPRFRNNSFTLTEYMSWYSKDRNKGYFSYPEDWGGFNFPAKIIQEVWDKGISDPNHYDYLMRGLLGMIKDDGAEDAYLIGTFEGQDYDRYLRHEIAHGLFYTNSTYQMNTKNLIGKLPYNVFTRVKDALHKKGYPSLVVEDEMQAYSSCGEKLVEFEYENDAVKYEEFIASIVDVYNRSCE